MCNLPPSVGDAGSRIKVKSKRWQKTLGIQMSVLPVSGLGGDGLV